MSIELSSAPKGTKEVASADPNNKKAGKPANAQGAGSGGFSALMALLSATEDVKLGQPADASLSDAPLVEKDGLDVDVAAAGASAALLWQPFPAPVSVVIPEFETVPEAALMTSQVGESGIPGSDVSADAPQFVDGALQQPTAASNSLSKKNVGQQTTADTGALQKLPLTNGVSDALSVSTTVGQSTVDLAQASPASALLAHKSAVQAQTLDAVQQDFKALGASAVSQSSVPAADAAATLLAGAGSDLVRPQGRLGAKSGLGQSGSSGFEGAFGQTMSAASRSDAVFEVPPASAVVADTAVAETVSYWASHGVQTAELTLEGFGNEPVEVSILLNGDQAQIDFRTDQVGVRQALENAAAQLKDLLSSQGLQLAGVSVGASGKGSDSGGERRQRPGSQQITMLKTEVLGAAAVRATNPAVGRSLDLFV